MNDRRRPPPAAARPRPNERSPERRAEPRAERRHEPRAERAPNALPEVSGDRLEGRNIVLEALVRKRRRVLRIWLDAAARASADPNDKVNQILALGGDRVKRVDRQMLDRMSQTGVHNGVIAEAEPFPDLTIAEVLETAFRGGRDPCFVLVDEVNYEHNLGAILRSALGAGVDGVVIPVQRGKGLTPIVQRVSMGGAEAVPVIREGISSALAQLKRAGFTIVGADMDGAPPWGLPLAGPVAFVLGGEDKGLTDPVRKRCDHIAGVPLAGGLESLNVSVTAGVLLFERVRQRAQ